MSSDNCSRESRRPGSLLRVERSSINKHWDKQGSCLPLAMGGPFEKLRMDLEVPLAKETGESGVDLRQL